MLIELWLCFSCCTDDAKENSVLEEKKMAQSMNTWVQIHRTHIKPRARASNPSAGKTEGPLGGLLESQSSQTCELQFQGENLLQNVRWRATENIQHQPWAPQTGTHSCILLTHTFTCKHTHKNPLLVLSTPHYHLDCFLKSTWMEQISCLRKQTDILRCGGIFGGSGLELES